jgi:hypothetical protein
MAGLREFVGPVWDRGAGDSASAGEFFPIIHTLFSNIKTWLVGTHHGVNAKISRATSGNGPTGSIAATCRTVWTAI